MERGTCPELFQTPLYSYNLPILLGVQYVREAWSAMMLFPVHRLLLWALYLLLVADMWAVHGEGFRCSFRVLSSMCRFHEFKIIAAVPATLVDSESDHVGYAVEKKHKTDKR